jgi:hypothetical protein
MAIKLKSRDEIAIMREAGRIVGNTLEQLRAMIKPGLNVLEIEKFVREEFKRHGARETFLNYAPGDKKPYPSNAEERRERIRGHDQARHRAQPRVDPGPAEAAGDDRAHVRVAQVAAAHDLADDLDDRVGVDRQRQAERARRAGDPRHVIRGPEQPAVEHPHALEDAVAV